MLLKEEGMRKWFLFVMTGALQVFEDGVRSDRICVLDKFILGLKVERPVRSQVVLSVIS